MYSIVIYHSINCRYFTKPSKLVEWYKKENGAGKCSLKFKNAIVSQDVLRGIFNESLKWLSDKMPVRL